ncbi:hypothetical protein VARIO8X_120070 [Burkholderiales bacterium 8X]|nr:hypothetical protein VARIO8X_120070 [Burkholderiales bacterium 8X]
MLRAPWRGLSQSRYIVTQGSCEAHRPVHWLSLVFSFFEGGVREGLEAVGPGAAAIVDFARASRHPLRGGRGSLGSRCPGRTLSRRAQRGDRRAVADRGQQHHRHQGRPADQPFRAAPGPHEQQAFLARPEHLCLLRRPLPRRRAHARAHHSLRAERHRHLDERRHRVQAVQSP